MVNANELRLGNWISYNGKYYEVDEIWFDLDEGAYYTQDFNINFISPIPLTEELLLKCGFERNKTYKRYFYNGISISKYEGEKYFVFDGWRFRAIDIKYLHQLQNLYFILTGEELTINL